MTYSPLVGGHAFVRYVPALPASVGLLRDMARDHLLRWGLPEPLIEDAVLVVSELATNSLKACPGKLIGLEMYTLPRALLVELWDSSADRPVRREAGEEDVNGRGLAIVEALAERWGTRWPPEGGKTVWVRLSREN